MEIDAVAGAEYRMHAPKRPDSIMRIGEPATCRVAAGCELSRESEFLVERRKWVADQCGSNGDHAGADNGTRSSTAICANDRYGGGCNRSTQHLLILPNEEVSVWSRFQGSGSRRSRRLNFGSAGGAVSALLTSPDLSSAGTRVGCIECWRSPGGSLRRRGEERLQP